jgi:acetyl-CoA acyltransferase
MTFISGAVGQIGEQSGNTARWTLLGAGYPESVPGVTVDRQCGSSQQALHFAAQGVIAGAYDVAIASGAESMSRVPIGSQMAGKDFAGPFVHARYHGGLVPQGISAELIAQRWDLSLRSSTSTPRSRTGVPPPHGRPGCSTPRSPSSTS